MAVNDKRDQDSNGRSFHDETRLRRSATGVYCFWLSSACGMLDMFLMAFFVHTCRVGMRAGLLEMLNPVTVGGIVVGGLMVAFLISIDRHLVSVFLVQTAFVMLSFIGVLLARVDFESFVELLKTVAGRGAGVMTGLVSVIDSIPDGRLTLFYIASYGLFLYFCIFFLTKTVRRTGCVYARCSSAGLCVFGLLLSFFFINVGRDAGVGPKAVTFGGIVEETLMQNRFLNLSEKMRCELQSALLSGDAEATSNDKTDSLQLEVTS